VSLSQIVSYHLVQKWTLINFMRPIFSNPLYTDALVRSRQSPDRRRRWPSSLSLRSLIALVPRQARTISCGCCGRGRPVAGLICSGSSGGGSSSGRSGRSHALLTVGLPIANPPQKCRLQSVPRWWLVQTTWHVVCVHPDLCRDAARSATAHERSADLGAPRWRSRILEVEAPLIAPGVAIAATFASCCLSATTSS